MDTVTNIEPKLELSPVPSDDAIDRAEAAIASLRTTIETLRRQREEDMAEIGRLRRVVTEMEQRGGYVTFGVMDDWNAPGMELYDDYDANMAKLKERLAKEAQATSGEPATR